MVDNPNLKALFYRNEIPDFLRKIYDETGASGLRTAIYEFLLEEGG